MRDFDEVWKAAVSFRRVSHELRGLLHDVHAAFAQPDALAPALERLLEFLITPNGRTDANCSATDAFIARTEATWRTIVSEPLAAILDDMGGTLHDSVHAPNIAKTFEATPEQLLERLRRL